MWPQGDAEVIIHQHGYINLDGENLMNCNMKENTAKTLLARHRLNPKVGGPGLLGNAVEQQQQTVGCQVWGLNHFIVAVCNTEIAPNITKDTYVISWPQKLILTLTVLVTTIDAQWEGMGDVWSARYKPALLPPCPTISVLSYSN